MPCLPFLGSCLASSAYQGGATAPTVCQECSPTLYLNLQKVPSAKCGSERHWRRTGLVCRNVQGGAGSAPRAPQRRQRSRQASAGGRPWTLPSLKRALGGQRSGQRSASEGSSALSTALAAAAQGGGEEDEALDTIYANWGTLQGREDAGACLLRPDYCAQR